MPSAMSPEEQKQIINEFRNRLADIIEEEDTDASLLKWLKARTFNLDQSEDMFRKSRQFKKKLNVKQIYETYEPPEVLQKYMPGGLFGFDKDGSPIKVELFGKLDMKGIMNSAKKSDLEKTRILQCERTIKLWDEQSKKLNKEVDGLTVIFDMAGASMKSLWRPGLMTYLYLASVLEDNYPEMMKQMLVLNAPSIFPIFWKICRPLVSEEMRAKIHIYGSNYKEELLKHVDKNQLPAFLGGTVVDPIDGNEWCTSLICPGGEVPKSYYLSENSVECMNYESVTVASGSHFSMEFDIEYEGSILKWEFRTEAHDISFGVTRKQKNSKKEEDVIKSKRVQSQLMVEEGNVECDKKGTYKIKFDNSYSWTKSKQLQYLVELYTNEDHSTELDQFVEGSWTRFVGNKQITHL